MILFGKLGPGFSNISNTLHTFLKIKIIYFFVLIYAVSYIVSVGLRQMEVVVVSFVTLFVISASF